MAKVQLERRNEAILHALSEILRSIKDPRMQGMVSVTHCEATKDLKYCKVFVSVLGTKEEGASTLKALKSAAGFIRRELSKKVELRNTPELSFHLDDSITHGAHITSLLNGLKELKDDHERT